MTDAKPPPFPLQTAANVRAYLQLALRDDLIGPLPSDVSAEVGAAAAHFDSQHQSEMLEESPSRWYLTGFLAPLPEQSKDDAEVDSDPEAAEELTSALDAGEESETGGQPARRPVFPSSIGLSVLLPATATVLHARVTYGTYNPLGQAAAIDEASPHGDTPPSPEPARQPWLRTSHDQPVSIYLAQVPADAPHETSVPESAGLQLVTRLRPASEEERELRLLPVGTRYATIFLVNRRLPVARPLQDQGYVFQVRLELKCDAPLVPRPNLRGARPSDDIDERVGDLHYCDVFEYAVGHGIAAEAGPADPQGQVYTAATAWVPKAEVAKVEPARVANVELSMAALGQLQDAGALRTALGPLPLAYRQWIAEQVRDAARFDGDSRRKLALELLENARRACQRIEDGIAALALHPDALLAFRIANRAMNQQAWQRQGEQLKARGEVPTWRPFQLAFLLMNIAAQVEPTHSEREIVDLIFFPTGGGKTEAYLGLAAFVMALRRLRLEGVSSGGVTVLMRYTLRLLTMDQLERAATLVCALECERRRGPDGRRLGPQRFSIGLWVGKAATPNRFGSDQDHDETSAWHRVRGFRKDSKLNPSPIPMDKCPWCHEPFNQDTFELEPRGGTPTQLRVRCTSATCEFRWQRDFPEGLPVVAVDEEIYRELPPFLIATVDKFAALPWVGKTGLLLGRDVTHGNELGYYGSSERPPTARPLPQPLLPPDLIIQDELHLISGPLGTMVGLYETALDHLTTRSRQHGGAAHAVRPKIIASTATVRRAQAQIQALFGRNQVDVFPPPGPSRSDSFFAVVSQTASPRLYIGVAAPGRSQKVLLMRCYIALLTAAQRAYRHNPQAADPYMTLLGYFNSLRELGGSQRIVEDEVRARSQRVSRRARIGEVETLLAERTIAIPCVELTSRKSTDEVKIAKERLDQRFDEARGGKRGAPKSARPPVDVALASNMISVGVDVPRLGLMVVCGQPKTTAEYIQATSRVGRDDKRPGLVVALLNVHKPRDRSHYEHFAAFHSSFYRAVEATSVTPFSPRAVDRGLCAVVVALARLGDARLTPADAAQKLPGLREDLGFVANVLAHRAEVHKAGAADDEPIDEVKATLRRQVESLLDSWVRIARNDPAQVGLAYQKHEDQESERPLLHMPLDPELADADPHIRRFVANRSLRDVEGVVDLYVTKLGAGARATRGGQP